MSALKERALTTAESREFRWHADDAQTLNAALVA